MRRTTRIVEGSTRTSEGSARTSAAAGVMFSLCLFNTASGVSSTDFGSSTGDPSHSRIIETIHASTATPVYVPDILEHLLSYDVEEWFEYLAQMSDRGRLTTQLMTQVRSIWAELNERLGRRLPLPITTPTDEGTVQLAWNTKTQYVDIEVYPDGSIEWFYRNRTTDEVDGTDDERCLEISDSLLARMRFLG